MKKIRRALGGLVFALFPLMTACAVGDAAEVRVESSLEPVAATAGSTKPTQRNGIRLEVAPEGNQARYRVREQLAGFDLPNDAVGVTDAVSGAIVLTADGSVDAAASRIVVNVTGLKSDSDRRDGFIQRRLLMTEEYPTVTLQPLSITGLPNPLPQNGARRLELRGELTVQGTTRPTSWQLDANFDGDRVTGTAATAFTFHEFGLTQPRVPVVLSVADTIRLEYDFTLIRTPVPGN